MATKCDCTGKFVGLETGEPEEQNIDVDDLEINIEVRVTRNCTECGDEKKEFNYTINHNIEEAVEAHMRQYHPEAETAEERPSFSIEAEYSVDEQGGGRYKKNMIRLEAAVTVTCDACPTEHNVVYQDTLSEEAAASEFEEL